jgi:hypothetical protein
MNTYTKFFKAYYTEMEEYFSDILGEEYDLTPENYWEKVLKPTSVQDEDFLDIESKIKKPLPEALKDFYKSHYSLEEEIDLGAYRLAGNLEGTKLKELSVYIENDFTQELIKIGLFPFGLGQDDWYICLDFNQDEINPPIVLFEMSSSTKSHRNWFSSFEKFIQCMTDWLENGDSDNFQLIDSKNHFLTAYDYWK